MISLDDGDLCEADIGPIDERVEQAASLLVDGAFDLADFETYDVDGETDEEFRQAIEERAEEIRDKATSASSEASAGGARNPTDVDWEPLSDEMGLGPPVSRTQLLAALSASEQTAISRESAAADLVAAAVEAGVIHEVYTDCGLLRGYTWGGL